MRERKSLNVFYAGKDLEYAHRLKSAFLAYLAEENLIFEVPLKLSTRDLGINIKRSSPDIVFFDFESVYPTLTLLEEGLGESFDPFLVGLHRKLPSLTECRELCEEGLCLHHYKDFDLCSLVKQALLVKGNDVNLSVPVVRANLEGLVVEELKSEGHTIWMHYLSEYFVQVEGVNEEQVLESLWPMNCQLAFRNLAEGEAHKGRFVGLIGGVRDSEMEYIRYLVLKEKHEQGRKAREVGFLKLKDIFSF